MKISFINSVGALALAGLSVSLAPSSLSAGDFARGERHPQHHESHCNRLPHGARCVNYRGERCWTSGGAYYRINPLGGFVLFQPTVEAAVIEQPAYEETVVVKRPVVKETIVEEPVVEEAQETVVEEPVLEEEDTVVEALPAGAEVVVIGGERCWQHDGVFYRHCNHGYKVCHSRNKGVWHDHNGHFNKGHDLHSTMNHGNISHAPHQTKNHGNMNMGHNAHQVGSRHDKHN